MSNTILMIHGRSFKPSKAKLQKLWYDALSVGFSRDSSIAKQAAFKNAKKDFIYYGDISNRFLKKALKKPNHNTDDSASRRQTLTDLRQFGIHQFTKTNYNKLPGKSAAGEALADLFGGIAAFFRVSDPLIEKIAPDMREYWNYDSQFGSDVRATVTAPLKRAMDRGDKILIIGHSLGSIIAYDVLWKFSRMSEYRPTYSNKNVDLLMTLGSPLADETVKRKVKGANASGKRKYPSNIRRWINVAAEDDYISHDEKVRNDYRKMITPYGLVNSIEDFRIYNLAVRNRTSNPHSSAGYLVHPKVIKIIADWL